MNPNLNQRLKQALYSLRKEYGVGPVSVYTAGSFTTNLVTGHRVVNNSVVVLRRAILLPASAVREAVQTISQISANKSFVVGGSFDTRSRIFIFERPACPDLTDQDWIVFENQKYEINEIGEYSNIAYVVKAKQLLDDIPNQIHPLANDDLIEFTSEAEVE